MHNIFALVWRGSFCENIIFAFSNKVEQGTLLQGFKINK